MNLIALFFGKSSQIIEKNCLDPLSKFYYRYDIVICRSTKSKLPNDKMKGEYLA